MKISFKKVMIAWLITAFLVTILNLIWFFANTAKTGNPWSDVIGPLPVIVMSFASTFIGSLVYWLISLFLPKAHIYFAIGAIVLTVLSVMGNPKLSDGTIVPAAFRIIDIPMHFVAGLFCAFLVPILAKDNLFLKRNRME